MTNATFEMYGPRGKHYKMAMIDDSVNNADTIDTTMRTEPIGAIITHKIVPGTGDGGRNVAVASYALLTTTGTYAATVAVTNSVGAAATALASVTAVFFGA